MVHDAENRDALVSHAIHDHVIALDQSAFIGIFGHLAADFRKGTDPSTRRDEAFNVHICLRGAPVFIGVSKNIEKILLASRVNSMSVGNLIPHPVTSRLLLPGMGCNVVDKCVVQRHYLAGIGLPSGLNKQIFVYERTALEP